MKDNYILREATYNIWCAPSQDNQFILKLHRLTPYGGVVGTWKYLWDTVQMPESGNWFHLFHVGQVNPKILSLSETKDTWIKLSQVCNDKRLIIDIYNSAGIKLPNSDVYYIYTKDNNLLIAFKDLKIPKFNYNYDDVYFRTYKNTFFESNRFTGSVAVYTEGGLITSNDKILEIQNKIIAKRLLPGAVYCFINGFKTEDINLTNTVIGDYVEFIYDSSIKRIVDFPINGLPIIHSTMDNKNKYILHYSGVTNRIDYNDDVEIFVQLASTGRGVYVHKNNRDTLRNITHKDFTVSTIAIQNAIEQLKVNSQINMADVRIRLYIKKSGFERDLMLERNRINELYKLPDNIIMQALTGVNSNVSVWRADSLESCDYIKLMRYDHEQITKSICADAFGYSSVAKQVANTPSDTYNDSGVIKANVPYLLAKSGCTAFEYDINGQLLGWVIHPTGDTHVCQNTNAKKVEFIAGIGGDELDESYTLTNNTLNEYVNYRFYTCGLVNSVYDNNWIDVTNTANYSVNQYGSVTWSVNNKLTMIRSDKKFFCKDYVVNFNRGIIEIPLTYSRTIQNTIVTDVMKVPMGEIVVFMNGKSLIEGLDYYLDYKKGKVVIVNKSYLVGTDQQNVTIRFTGFCDNELKPNSTGEYGFIQQGRVSDNHRFDIKDGKVQRIVVNGSLRTPTQISYYDDVGSGTVFNDDNGKPYQIKDLIIPMKDVAERETYAYKKQSDLIDSEISDFMTLHINQVSQPIVNVTSSKHYLYSPFLARILDDLLTGIIDSEPLTTRFTRDFITTVCKPYEYLLDFDPIKISNQHSRDYVIVHLHRFNNTVALELSKYRFITKVIEIYANGNIEQVTQIRLA